MNAIGLAHNPSPPDDPEDAVRGWGIEDDAAIAEAARLIDARLAERAAVQP